MRTFVCLVAAIVLGTLPAGATTWNLAADGERASCRSCGAAIAGVFESRPGTWGARRQAIHVRH